MVRMMPKKKRAADRKLIRVDRRDSQARCGASSSDASLGKSRNRWPRARSSWVVSVRAMQHVVQRHALKRRDAGADVVVGNTGEVEERPQ